MPGAFISFLALALDVEHLVFVSWIKPREIFSKHIEQSAWGGSVLTMALSVYKSNHVILLLEALIAFLNSNLCVTRLWSDPWLLRPRFPPHIHLVTLAFLLFLKHAEMLLFQFLYTCYPLKALLHVFAYSYRSLLLFIIQISAETLE